MSKPSPYNLTIGEDGLSVRCEWDVHYLTDEQLETVRRHVETLQDENAKLRELVRDMLACINNVSAHDTYCWDYCDFCKMYKTKGRCDFESRMRELGVDE